MSREWSTEPISYLITGHNWWDTSVDQIELLFRYLPSSPNSQIPHLPTLSISTEKFLLVIHVCNENFMTSKLLFATNFTRYLPTPTLVVVVFFFFVIICHSVIQTVITRKNLFTLMNQFWKIYSIFTCNPISLLFNDVVDFLLYTTFICFMCIKFTHLRLNGTHNWPFCTIKQA